MSVDHSPNAASPFQNRPQFLDVRSGNFVIVRAPQEVTRAEKDFWWMGQVLCCEGGARDSNINSLFQVADVDDGAVRWVNADEVIHILHSIDGLFD